MDIVLIVKNKQLTNVIPLRGHFTGNCILGAYKDKNLLKPIY